MYTLTVIIPGYNIEKFIDKIMKSLLADAVIPDIQILVVNDGSKDRTQELAEAYEKKYPGCVRALSKENGGHGSTINYGMKYAEGKYVKVIDGDDWVNTETLIDLISWLKVTDVDLVAANYCIVNENTGESTEKKYDKVQYRKIYKFDQVCNWNDSIEFHSLIYKKDVLKKNYKQIDEHCFYVDTEHILYPLINAQTIAFYEKDFYMYRGGDVNQSVSFESYVRNRKQLKTVVLHLAEFYEEENLKIPNAVSEYISRRISKIISVLFSIYIKMPYSKKSKGELIEFDSELKKTSFYLYDMVQLRIKILRILNYHGMKGLRKIILMKNSVNERGIGR